MSACHNLENNYESRPAIGPDGPSTANDARLLSLDFLAETGELLASFGAAICAAAAAENVEVLELALRHARGALLDGIAEFKALGPKLGGAE